jgi:hypothetical protein
MTVVEDETDKHPRNIGSIRFPDGSSIVRPGELPWTPWALEGTSFKLLSINRRLGAWSALVKFDPGTIVPPQRRFGDGFIYVMEGDYVADDDPVATGEFSVETGGATRGRKVGPRGLLSYMMLLGGISAVDADGRPTGAYIDAEWMFETATAHDGADHLPPAPLRRKG